MVGLNRSGTVRFRVVLVNDSEDMRSVWYQFLEYSGQFEVVGRAADGGGGLRMCRVQQPDAVITDWKMPNLNGIEMACQLRTEQPDLVIVLCTSSPFADVRSDLDALRMAYVDNTRSGQLPAFLLSLLISNPS